MDEFHHIVSKPWIERLQRLDADSQKALALDRQARSHLLHATDQLLVYVLTRHFPVILTCIRVSFAFGNLKSSPLQNVPAYDVG
jgi:hypothetical protein